MKLADILKELKSNSFTCSSGAQLLAEQPTRDEVSHAHIHSLDAFSVDVGKIKPASFQAPSTVDVTALKSAKKDFWENPEVHLQPEGSGAHTSTVFDPATKDVASFKPYEFYVDKTKLASNDTYLKRGMTEIAEKTQTTFTHKLVFKPSGATKPISQDFPVTSKTDKASVPTGGALVKDVGVVEKTTKIHPTFQAMEAHSMFEDSEVLVMATTAVILSDAGLVALTELDKKAAGSYIAVFSASAVAGVDDTFKKKSTGAPLKMVERSPASVKVNTTGAPTVETKGATYKKVDMKRAVLVIKKDVAGDLIIVTCYPSQQHPTVPPTLPPTPPPAAADDVVELDKSAADYRIVKQATPIVLKW